MRDKNTEQQQREGERERETSKINVNRISELDQTKEFLPARIE